MKTLIVNADDFGLSAEVNAGILRAHREGIVTSASLMVAEPCAEDAARAARENPQLDVGLHAVVCRGRSVLGRERLGALVESDGGFSQAPTFTGLRLFFDRKLRDALAAELRAQVERHLSLIGYLNHIDGHLNFHVHPTVADILIELAVEFKVPCIRLPREPVWTTLALSRRRAKDKLVESIIFRALCGRTDRLLRAHGIRSTDRLFGLHQSGLMTEQYVLGVIDRLRDGSTELYFHPTLDIGGTPPPAAGQLEVQILTSARVRAALDAHPICLTTFANLVRTAAS